MSSKSRLSVYKDNQDKQARGVVDFIPFAIPSLRSFIPGLIPGIMYKITSHTGNGKTQFAKYIVFSSVFNMIKARRKLTVVYVALEESKEEFTDSLYLFVVNVLLKVPMQYYDLLGYSGRRLTDSQLNALQQAESYVKQFLECIIVVDDVYTSNGIYDKCKEIASRYGDIDPFTETFKPKEEDRLFLLMVDHVSLIKDPKSSTFESMAEWHTNTAKRVITKKWNWIVVHIQQQNLDSEKQQFNMKGQSVIEKLIPSMDGLGDNRTLVRDDYVVMGLFSPARYRVPIFNGYNIDGNSEDALYAIGDNFRMLYVLKNRLGTPNKAIPLFFDGSCSYFSAMPRSEDPSAVAHFLEEKADEFNKSRILS